MGAVRINFDKFIVPQAGMTNERGQAAVKRRFAAYELHSPATDLGSFIKNALKISRCQDILALRVRPGLGVAMYACKVTAVGKL
jgi:hypothetical protein